MVYWTRRLERNTCRIWRENEVGSRLFGYIRIYRDELKVREYERFKAYYCGLCREIKRSYGFAAHMALSYDAAFLSLLLCSVQGSADEAAPCRCMSNPLVKRPAVCSNPYLAYGAAVNTVLARFKLVDDWRDDHSVKALLALTLLRGAKLRREWGGLYRTVQADLAVLSALEDSGCAVPDEAADRFGALMEHIFVLPITEPDGTRRVLGHIGYLLGRFIYLLDAVADRERDAKKSAYNPFNLKYPGGMDEKALAQAKDALTFTLSELSHTYALLDVRQNAPILDNIIYLGLPDTLDRVFDGRYKRQKRHGGDVR